MKHPESKGLIAAFVLVLAGAALHADPAEDEAVQAIMRWGGKIIRDETSNAKPVIGPTR